MDRGENPHLSTKIPPWRAAAPEPMVAVRKKKDLLLEDPPHDVVTPTVETDPERFRPTDHAVGDASRLRAATGWQPEIAIEDTLASVVDYWREFGQR